MSSYLAKPKGDGVTANSIMLIGTVVNDPAKEQEFNDWYNNMHLADVLETEGYTAAVRFERVDPGNSPGNPKFLAIYEMSSHDPMAAPTAMKPLMDKKRTSGRRPDFFEAVMKMYLRRAR